MLAAAAAAATAGAGPLSTAGAAAAARREALGALAAAATELLQALLAAEEGHELRPGAALTQLVAAHVALTSLLQCARRGEVDGSAEPVAAGLGSAVPTLRPLLLALATGSPPPQSSPADHREEVASQPSGSAGSRAADASANGANRARVLSGDSDSGDCSSSSSSEEEAAEVAGRRAALADVTLLQRVQRTLRSELRCLALLLLATCCGQLGAGGSWPASRSPEGGDSPVGWVDGPHAAGLDLEEHADATFTVGGGGDGSPGCSVRVPACLVAVGSSELAQRLSGALLSTMNGAREAEPPGPARRTAASAGHTSAAQPPPARGDVTVTERPAAVTVSALACACRRATRLAGLCLRLLGAPCNPVGPFHALRTA
jgi:hypothetical protein